MGLQIIGDPGNGADFGKQLPALCARKRSVGADGALIGENVTVLLLGHGFHRIADPEADKQKRHTASDTQNGHKEPFFVAEQVAARRFLCEIQAQPNKVDVFEEGAFAGFRRFGAHQRGRAFGKHAMACRKRAADGRQYREHRCNHGVQHVHFDNHVGKVDINGLVSVNNQRRQQRFAERHAEYAAQQR